MSKLGKMLGFGRNEHYDRAVHLFDQGLYEEAITACERARTVEKHDAITDRLALFYIAEAHGNLGLCAMKRGAWEHAEHHYRMALEIHPHYADLHYSLALVLRRRLRYDEALAALDDALDINPRFAKAHFHRGITLYASGAHEEGMNAIRTALEMEPAFGTEAFHQSVLAHEKGDFSEAQNALETVSATEVDDILFYLRLGDDLYRRGMFEEAVDEYRKARDLNPNYADVHIRLGLALNANLPSEEAVQFFNTALSINPENSEAWINLGITNRDEGRMEESINALKEEATQQHSVQLEELQEELEQQNTHISDTMVFLERANRRFSDLFMGLPIACYTYDLEGRIHEWNDACEWLYGFRPEEVFEKTIWETIVRPEDADGVQELIARVFAGASFASLECVNLRSDGSSLNIQYSTFPMRDPNGEIVGAISANIDITERLRAEEALRRSEARNRALLNAIPDRIFRISSQGVYLDCHVDQEDDLPIAVDEIVGKTIYDLLPLDAAQATRRCIENALQTNAPQAIEYRLDRQGELRVYEVRIVVSGEEEVLSMVRDVTERTRAEQQIVEQMEEINRQKTELEAANTKLKDLAMMDGLTGLKNHRAFQERLEQEFDGAVRYQTPLSVVLLDVDWFKQYNDTFGHPAGDEVLKAVARLLQESARTCDFIARHGGEEFVAILPNTDQEVAISMAERFRRGIETAPWSERSMTASFGIASVTVQTASRKQLIAEADTALYASKQNGRNLVSHYDDLQVGQGAAQHSNG